MVALEHSEGIKHGFISKKAYKIQTKTLNTHPLFSL